MDLQTIIDPRAYKEFAGPDWPSLDDIVNNRPSSLPHIAAEVAEFVRMQRENYEAVTLSGTALALANQQRQRQQFYNKKYAGPQCQIPWNTLGINSNGDAYICSSPSWIPLFVGNILEVDDVFDLLNSDTAQRIRQEILAGSYYYCNNKICSFFGKINPSQYASQTANDQPQIDNFSEATRVNTLPNNLILDFDYTCNLHCASCRTEVINHNTDHVRRPTNDRIVEKIKRLIIDRAGNSNIIIRWCGGEPFISAVYLDLLQYIADQNLPNIKHVIQTNGHYLQSRAELINKLAPNIVSFRISFDAATAETYSRVRRGGSWTQLVKNAAWLVDFCKQNYPQLEISADYVVQLDNYKEIPAFVDLCNTLGIKKIFWQKMWNWGTWPDTEFDNKNIYNPQHPLYADLRSVFAQANQSMNY